MSFPELKYLLVPAGSTDAADNLEAATEELRANGFEFTGKIEEIRTVLFFKLEFIKREESNDKAI